MTAAAGADVCETGIRALSFRWSETDRQQFRSPPYPLPAGLALLIGRLDAALPAEHEAFRQGLLRSADLTPGADVPSSAHRGVYVPWSAGGGSRVMARSGLPRVLLDLLLYGVLTPADGGRLVEAAELTDLSAADRGLVVRDLLLRLVEVNLMSGDVTSAEQVAARMAPEWEYLGWREIASCHAANGDAGPFFGGWSRYDARRDRAQMQSLKTQLVQGVAVREGWQAAVGVCGDKRIGDSFLRHAFEPPAYGYDELVTVFGGDAAGVLTEVDELHCLVAAAVAESRPRPLADHRGAEDLLARIGALNPNESRQAMRARDHLLSTLYLAIGSEDTLARLRKQLRTPRLRSEARRLFTGPPDSGTRP
ncbi:hypothetical protein [Occultella gossypii]|uniref:Uncharacterized protein n=1 Tax=Occultella gossypii TaxID=2800820 RepID=A0ABS7S8K4_9MICO|nr:hypothetical protein [Occultella gossypii]MBZ2196565.1 hypothetical protein [Occultella gossypii]